MDFKQFDIRSAADEAKFCRLVHPFTKAPLMDGDEEVGFMVIGRSSRKGQAALKKVEKTANTRKGGTAEENNHQEWVATAAAFIVDSVGLEFDGKPVGSDKAQIKAVLDATFPEFRAKQEDELDDPSDLEAARMRLLNAPFAFQVLQFAARQDNFLGE